MKQCKITSKGYRPAGWIFLFLLLVPLQWAAASSVPQGRTLEDAYPGLASGALTYSGLADLEKNVILQSAGITIGLSELEDLVKKAPADIQPQLKKNLFFILEQQATEKILLHEAEKSGLDKAGSKEEMIQAYLEQKFSGATVSDEEAKAFYEQNKDAVDGMPFDQVKENIKEYLAEDKMQEAVSDHIRTAGKRMEIRLNRKWLETQAALARDNPVDRARSSGKPTMIEFGSTGCVPCDMMQPILESLKKKYPDSLNVVFVHVGQERILGARYGIRSIPVQAFFDDKGKEVFRHTGFYAEAEVIKVLQSMGVK
jgi:thiol-disulfide isomerase/thioredoxin